MEPTTATGKQSGHVRNLLVRSLLFGMLLIGVRFAYVVTLAGETCNLGDFCFFSLRDNLNFVIPNKALVASSAAASSSSDIYTSKDWIKAVQFYSSVFQDLVAEGYLSPASKALCVETPLGQEVSALKEIGVGDSIGVSRKASKPLVLSYKKKTDDRSSTVLPFPKDWSFDLVFSGGARFNKALRPLDLASEITRVLKPQGFVVAHVRARDEYSFHSFLDLFNSCTLVKSHDLDGYDASLPRVTEIVLRKEGASVREVGSGDGRCSVVPEYKRELVNKAEPLIAEEPLKPWITLKRNIQNIKYLPSVADISFKNRYVYVDVGARSYGSSIGSWFRKQYPKQNRTFDVYAIEADKHFHQEYGSKKGVTLLPYAAWVRNETLSFEINRDPGQDVKDKGRGMGRIQPVMTSSSSGSFNGVVDEIEGFDFAAWLKRMVKEKDFVVMKMDVEGTEFELIPRLFETGAICLIDEIFLECHYNRWQRCCPGERSAKYEKTYGQCLELFTSLRDSGVLVHQWW